MSMSLTFFRRDQQRYSHAVLPFPCAKSLSRSFLDSAQKHGTARASKSAQSMNAGCNTQKPVLPSREWQKEFISRLVSLEAGLSIEAGLAATSVPQYSHAHRGAFATFQIHP